jgi:Ca-activated chloride channel family protein
MTSKSIFSSIAALAVCVGCLTSALAQQGSKPVKPAVPSADPQNPDTTVVKIRRVQLPVTVTDKKGQFVTGLTRQDFQIFEDKQPQSIDTFSAEEKEALPLYIGVLMDTSPSVAGKLKFEQDSAMNFIQTVVRPRRDRVAFVTFDHQINLRQDFTDKLDLLDRAVYGVKRPGDRTLFYDAVWQFCDEKMRNAAGRRVLVVITDGDDSNYSRATLKDAIDIAQRTETTVFAISTKAGFAGAVPGVTAGTVKDRVDKDLDRLCDETGGTAFFTGDILSLERSFTKIARELRTQYMITYKPTNDSYDGQNRKIEVRLVGDHDGLKIRSKKGYRATNDQVR